MTTRPKTRALAIATALLLVIPAISAENGFDKELGTDVDKIVDKIDSDAPGFGMSHGSSGGGGQAPYLQALGHPPKRVALVSLYAYDPGETKGFGSPYYGGRWEKTRQLSPDGAGLVATMLHDQGIKALKDTFAQYGMTLMTPDEYLDTDAKREFYDSFEMQMGAGAKFAKWGEKHGKENELSTAHRESAVAPGYRLFRFLFGDDPSMRPGDHKIFKSMGYDLPKRLGVDATVVICNYCKASKKEASLERVYFYVFGPNPVGGDEDSFTHWAGHMYAGYRLYHIGVPIVGFGKSEKVDSNYQYDPITGGSRSESLKEAGIAWEDYAGYERVLTAFAKKAGEDLQECTTKASN
jgi:hypothetical protein